MRHVSIDKLNVTADQPTRLSAIQAPVADRYADTSRVGW